MERIARVASSTAATAAGWAFLRKRMQKDALQTALVRLEEYAVRRNLKRNPGETPLAWLARLQSAAENEPDSRQLRNFAAAYERSVYSPAGRDARTQADLAASAAYFRRLR